MLSNECQMWHWSSSILHNNLYSYLIPDTWETPKMHQNTKKILYFIVCFAASILQIFKWLWNLQHGLSRIVFQPMFQLCSWPESPWVATAGQAWLSWYTDAFVFIFICSFLHRSDHMLMHLYMPNYMYIDGWADVGAHVCICLHAETNWNQWDFSMDGVSDAKNNDNK